MKSFYCRWRFTLIYLTTAATALLILKGAL